MKNEEHQKLRTKLALMKEKSETLMCKLLDESEDVLPKLVAMRKKNESRIIRDCIDIVIAELTYLKYSRALDDIDTNIGGKNENSSDW